jgi:CRISPR/Cas system CMR-associated protein Cmr5 small subunit
MGKQNLEQIRAKNALNVKIERKESDSKAIAKKVPSMIIENGLIATAAFACESNVKGYRSVFENGIIKHLADKDVGLFTKENMTLEEFIEYLTGEVVSSAQLRVITAEVMAYLNYLRRFA